ncbi:MAG TPA: Hsp70 family protein, partial [Myxococcaceae bacterium]
MWIAGIDLGTTNCALAWTDPSEGPGAAIHDFPVPQLIRPGEVSPRTLLPSFLYLPPEHERLPPVVGEMARWQGARTPGRVVSSAKAWLSHAGVDRQAPILPWGALADVPKISPVEASARLLAHLSESFRDAHPEHPLAESEVVLAVPASFDEAARALTVSAARHAGLQRFTLLEEPQAALYAFVSGRRADLSRALEGVRLVLVVDVGGGTTDFTLVQVEALPEGPALRRIAAGEHLLLGGDNMDAALARAAERKLSRGRLSAGEWTQLLQVARAAKEALLGADPPERYALSVAASGSRLIGGSFSVELDRAEVEALVLDGFFPRTSPEELPHRGARMAIQELGLPYAQDPGIPRHLAAFLQAHADGGFAALGEQRPGPGALPRPDAILLNGGVFRSLALARRVVDVASAWWPDRPRLRLLESDSLDLAVARGAAFHGLARRGLGLRIGGGAARAYYVGLSREAGAGDGSKPAVCLVPRGLEEGTTVEIERPFTLTLGRPVQFQ